mgnify:CR=1 FL=1
MANKKEDWLETLVKKYSIPTEEKTDKRGILNESQLKQRKTEIWLLLFVIISITGAAIFIFYSY